jgi:hypothetical protein
MLFGIVDPPAFRSPREKGVSLRLGVFFVYFRDTPPVLGTPT